MCLTIVKKHDLNNLNHSKHSLNRENQVIILMITDGENYYLLYRCLKKTIKYQNTVKVKNLCKSCLLLMLI